jgi:protein-disulfide isomerase
MARAKQTWPRAFGPPTPAQPAKSAPALPRWAVVIAALAALAAITSLVAAVGHTNNQAALERRTHHEVSTLLAGVPQQGVAIGQPTAPVTLQFFGDLECLTTKNWVTRLLPAIIEQFVRPGLLRIEYRSFKTDTRDPRTFVNQQTAALAAGAQNRLWDFIETFYHEQGREYTPYATATYIANIAKQIPGLNIARWRADRQIGRRSEQVVADDQSARRLGFHDTPAFRIAHTGQPLKTYVGHTIILEFAGFRRMQYPVSLINTQDLNKTIKQLAPR